MSAEYLYYVDSSIFWSLDICFAPFLSKGNVYLFHHSNTDIGFYFFFYIFPSGHGNIMPTTAQVPECISAAAMAAGSGVGMVVWEKGGGWIGEDVVENYHAGNVYKI